MFSTFRVQIMHLFLILLVLSSFISSSLSDPYVCAGTQTINHPANISVPWYYPSTWKTSDNAPQYAANQNCTWIINVPKGMYAYFSLKANTNQAPVLKMTDSVGYVTTIESSSLEPFFVMDPSFRVDLQSNQIGTLGMIVQWHTVNPTYPTIWPIHSKGSPFPLFGGDFDNSTVIQSDTRVSLLALTTSSLDFLPYLRLTQIYDGSSINSKHIGNLYQILASGTNYLSSGNSLTLFTLFPGFKTGNAVIFQDYADVKQFKSYKAISCILPNTCEISLDARQGTAAAIRYYPTPSFFVKGLAMPDSNQLSVYTDTVMDAHKLADYTSTTSKTNLPQKFSGKFTTFVLNQDHATIQFSSNAVDAKWTTAFDGRRGFFASPNYGIKSSDQSFTDQIFASETSDISYTADGSSLVGAATLNMVINAGQKAVINNTYSSSILVWQGLVKSTGDNIAINYQSNGAVSVGPFVTFRFEKHNSATTNGVLVSIIVSIWIALSL